MLQSIGRKSAVYPLNYCFDGFRAVHAGLIPVQMEHYVQLLLANVEKSIIRSKKLPE